MAKKFIYDDVGYLEGTFTDGTISSTTFSPSGSLTDEERLYDGSIATSVSSFANGDTLRVDLGGSESVTAVAAYFTSGSSGSLIFKYGSSTAITDTAATLSGLSAGWNTASFGAISNRYWFIEADVATVTNCAEIIIGTQYTFDQEPRIGNGVSKIHNSVVATSLGGIEYAFKQSNSKRNWSYDFEFLTSGIKTSLENVRDGLTGQFKKFIYYDGSAWYYVRMNDDSFEFTETSPNTYATNFAIREQLS
jgi:hypothetical protein